RATSAISQAVVWAQWSITGTSSGFGAARTIRAATYRAGSRSKSRSSKMADASSVTSRATENRRRRTHALDDVARPSLDASARPRANPGAWSAPSRLPCPRLVYSSSKLLLPDRDVHLRLPLRSGPLGHRLG